MNILNLYLRNKNPNLFKYLPDMSYKENGIVLGKTYMSKFILTSKCIAEITHEGYYYVEW